MNEHKYTNRLINEKSPYLLQHAHNPVDWYPWGEEAFKKAKHDDKPIFLSIGYSTCHWCHVMERESFENEEVAAVLNKNFICIKVDREERPDVDSIYMEACQAMTGSGGWPLTIVMTPEQKPFYAATYLPPRSRYHMAGVIELAEKINEMWENDREHITSFADDFAKRLSQQQSEMKEIKEYERIVRGCFDNLESSFDKMYGGFGRAPKFPVPHNLLFLMRYYNRYKNRRALDMAFKTLEAMLRGGIFDHIGGGFSRYSTDGKWLVPHFEKMLYDNALIAICYAEAYSIEPRGIFRDAAEKVLAYISENMTDEQGGFYSAEDADSEGKEGKFYLWSPEEVSEVLGEEKGEAFCRSFDISERGNFEGLNIPNLIGNNQWETDFYTFEQEKEKLKAARKLRIHPHKDDKILLGWNGLCIAAFAVCGRIFDNEEYIKTAVKAFCFIENNMSDKDTSRLYARYRDGEKKYYAYCDDYAYVIWAALELYEATAEAKYLEQAEKYAMEMIRLFWDKKGGGFLKSSFDACELIINPKDYYDNALPSGNSAAAYSLIRLGRIKDIETFVSYGKKTIDSFGEQLEKFPHAASFMCSAALFYESRHLRAALAGNPENEEYKTARKKLRSLFLPFADKIYGADNYGKDNANTLASENETVLYICDGFMCEEPVRGIGRIVSELNRLGN